MSYSFEKNYDVNRTFVYHEDESFYNNVKKYIMYNVNKGTYYFIASAYLSTEKETRIWVRQPTVDSDSSDYEIQDVLDIQLTVGNAGFINFQLDKEDRISAVEVDKTAKIQDIYKYADDKVLKITKARLSQVNACLGTNCEQTDAALVEKDHEKKHKPMVEIICWAFWREHVKNPPEKLVEQTTEFACQQKMQIQ